MEQIYDLVILGSGPAGLGASIYAQRAELKTLVIEKEMVSGGQVLTTYEVDNYAGLPGINGFDLGMKFREHADRLGAEFAEDSIIGIQQAGEDGAFFKKKTAAVVGGGDVAIEDAIFLARICEKVYLIHRRNELRGAKSLQKKLMEMENVEILWDTVADSINGENKVESLSLTNKKTGEKRELPVDGVFIAVGISPNTEGLEDLVAMDGGHYILAGEDGKTSQPGIFAAGDVRTKNLRQIVTAVADGANCVTSAERYLNGQQ